MKKFVKIYLRTTTDELELPIAVAGSPGELARMLHTTRGTVESAISKHYAGWHRIIVTEEDADQEASQDF